jgi:hypothetical protein
MSFAYLFLNSRLNFFGAHIKAFNSITLEEESLLEEILQILNQEGLENVS